MITIIVDNQNEYDEMMEFAQNYTCKQLPFGTCSGYEPPTCFKCYAEHHVEAGIQVIPPHAVENP